MSNDTKQTHSSVEVMKACLAEVGLNPGSVGLDKDGLFVRLGELGGQPCVERDGFVWRAFNIASPDTAEPCFGCFQCQAGHGPCPEHGERDD